MVISVKIGREEKEKELYKQGVKMMTGKFTQTAEPNSWELTNSRKTIGVSAHYQTRPSACGLQFSSLVCLRSPWQWDQDLSLMYELAFWTPFPMVQYFLSLDSGERDMFCLNLL